MWCNFFFLPWHIEHFDAAVDLCVSLCQIHREIRHQFYFRFNSLLNFQVPTEINNSLIDLRQVFQLTVSISESKFTMTYRVSEKRNQIKTPLELLSFQNFRPFEMPYYMQICKCMCKNSWKHWMNKDLIYRTWFCAKTRERTNKQNKHKTNKTQKLLCSSTQAHTRSILLARKCKKKNVTRERMNVRKKTNRLFTVKVKASMLHMISNSQCANEWAMWNNCNSLQQQ